MCMIRLMKSEVWSLTPGLSLGPGMRLGSALGSGLGAGLGSVIVHSK